MLPRESEWCAAAARGWSWPIGATEAAYTVFGPAIFNCQGRTWKALNRRIAHAMNVWDEKYGPLGRKQEDYVDKVLTWCVEQGAQDAREKGGSPYPYVLNLLIKAVNHEKVDAGFKRRVVDDAYGLDLGLTLAQVPR